MACLGVGWSNARRTRTRTAERAPRKAATSSALVSILDLHCLPLSGNSGNSVSVNGSEDDWRPSNLRAAATAANEARTRARARLELDAAGLVPGNAVAAAAMVLSVGRYKLGPVLRADAQCMVRVCTDKEDDECEYTVRVLEKNSVRRRGKASAIKREVAAMTEMNHNNILRLHDVVASVARLYLVYERVHGADLGAYVSKRGPLHPTHAQQLIRGIASALDHAHKRGVYHGSLAPNRIIIPRDECFSNAKVFGFSIFVPDDITTASANDALALAAILALVIAAAPPPLPKSAPCGARLLYNALQHPDPAKRPSMAEVLRTSWLSAQNTLLQRGNGLFLPLPPTPPPQRNTNTSASCKSESSTVDLTVSQPSTLSPSPGILDARNKAQNSYAPNRDCEQPPDSQPANVSPEPRSDVSSTEQFADAPDSFATEQTNSNEHKESVGTCATPDEKNQLHQSSSSSSANDTTAPVSLQLATIDSPAKCTLTQFSSPVTLPNDDPIIDDDDIPPYFASSALILRPDTKVAQPKASVVSNNAYASSSSISSSSEGECLARMVRSILPKYSPRRARRVVQKLNKVGVDNTDDIRFLVSSVGSCKNAADWFERVTDLSPVVCLRVVNAVASPQS